MIYLFIITIIYFIVLNSKKRYMRDDLLFSMLVINKYCMCRTIRQKY